MKPALLVSLVILIAAGAVLAVLLLNDGGGSPFVRATGSACSDQQPAAATPDHATPEQAAHAKMQTLATPQERMAHVDWIKGQPWAKSSLPVLRSTIVADPDEAVQLHAVEAALSLAQTEGVASQTGVVRTALASGKGNTRARGLKAAREHADPEFVSELIALVDNRDPYATMALTALAYTQSEQAHAKVSQVAHDETAERKLRERAVALLAVTKDKEALPLLRDLANGDDKTLAAIASEVIKEIHK